MKYVNYIIDDDKRNIIINFKISNKENITLKNMKIDLKDKTLIKPNENDIRIDKSGIEIYINNAK